MTASSKKKRSKTNKAHDSTDAMPSRSARPRNQRQESRSYPPDLERQIVDLGPSEHSFAQPLASSSNMQAIPPAVNDAGAQLVPSMSMSGNVEPFGLPNFTPLPSPTLRYKTPHPGRTPFQTHSSAGEVARGHLAAQSSLAGALAEPIQQGHMIRDLNPLSAGAADGEGISLGAREAFTPATVPEVFHSSRPHSSPPDMPKRIGRRSHLHLSSTAQHPADMHFAPPPGYPIFEAEGSSQSSAYHIFPDYRSLETTVPTSHASSFTGPRSAPAEITSHDLAQMAPSDQAFSADSPLLTEALLDEASISGHHQQRSSEIASHPSEPAGIPQMQEGQLFDLIYPGDGIMHAPSMQFTPQPSQQQMFGPLRSSDHSHSQAQRYAPYDHHSSTSHSTRQRVNEGRSVRLQDNAANMNGDPTSTAGPSYSATGGFLQIPTTLLHRQGEETVYVIKISGNALTWRKEEQRSSSVPSGAQHWQPTDIGAGNEPHFNPPNSGSR